MGNQPEGYRFYNADAKVLQYCDGVNWIAMHGPGTGSGGCTMVTRPGTKPEGYIFYNTDSRVMQACAGNVWRGMGPIQTAGSGGSCTDPDRPEGTLLYNTDFRAYQYCDGANWVSVGKAEPVMRDDMPDAFGFTDQTDVALSTLIESNIVQITGLDINAAVSISGDGSPQYRICDDTSCSSVDHDWAGTAGTIDDGQYLQLHLASNAANGTMNSAIVTVGSATGQWNVTTEAVACPGPANQVDDFETGLGNWVNVASDDRDWTRISGGTPSSNVGPTSGAGGGGYYVYTEASSPAAADEVFILESNDFDPGCYLAVQLKYNKRGDFMGDLYLEKQVDGGSWSTEWSHSGVDVAAGAADQWNAELISIGKETGTVKLRLRAVMPSSGTIWHSDIGIDDIAVSAKVFGFVDQIDVVVNTLTESNIAQISGVPPSTSVSISGDGSPEYRICGDSGCSSVDHDWSSGAGLIDGGQYLQLRLTSDASAPATSNATITVGAASDQWSVTTRDTTPDAFTFTDQTSVAKSTLVTSNIETITGIAGNVSVSITGDGSPEFRIDGGSWISGSATIANGETLQLRLTSSASGGTTNSATITIGTANDQWDVTTRPSCPGSPGAGDEGCEMPDGTIYAGQSPDGNVPMYTTSTDTGQYPWNNANNPGFVTTNQTSFVTGEANTANLITIDSDSVTAGTQPHQAAQACADQTAHGNSDWYLPAQNELSVLYSNRTVIGAFKTTGFSPYWSSTENSVTNAWGFHFSNGDAFHANKHAASNFVRCVRR